MFRLSLRIVAILMGFASVSACSKKKSDSSGPEEPDSTEESPTNPDSFARALAAASAEIAESNAPNEVMTALECPAPKDWQKLDTFAAPCTYVWTTDPQKLPIPPRWRPCSSMEGLPRESCKQLDRSARLTDFHLGTNANGAMQIGFVQACKPDRIVLADIDGPTRFALTREDTQLYPATCPVKLLAVDRGAWLGALGGHEIFLEPNELKRSNGGAILGGPIGSTIEILHALPDEPFHVPTSQGEILPDGWSANGKRRHWNGKPFEKAAHFGMVRLTKQLLVDEKKGFYLDKKPEPEPLFAVGNGHTIRYIRIYDRQIVWLDESSERSQDKCALFTAEIDSAEKLSPPRRVASTTCSPEPFAVGCNAVLLENESRLGLTLVSLTSGSVKPLHVKGHPAAVDCKEAFVERAGTLLRLDLQAFGAAKTLTSPLPDLPPPSTSPPSPKH